MEYSNKFIILDKKQLPKLPKGPGVYAFKKGKEILYIGKAANIRERVKSHFQAPGFKQGLFISQIKKIGFIRTNSEIEALILEANLIKKEQPRFNVAWKDDKNYFYVGFSKEEYPRVFITHQIKSQKLKVKTTYPPTALLPFGQAPRQKCKSKVKSLYIGPFVDGTDLKQALKVLRKVFLYRTCRNLPKRPCLWYELARCTAPCKFKIQNEKFKIAIKNSKSNELRKEYNRNIRNLIKVLKGQERQVLEGLKKDMQLASRGQDFERAAKLRDQATALKNILEHSRLSNKIYTGPQELQNWPAAETALKELLSLKNKIKRIEGYDVSNIQGQEATGSMVVFEEGQPQKEQYRKFRIKMSGKPNDTAMLKEVLERRFGHYEWKLPDLILIDGGVGQLSAALKIKIQNSKFKMTNQNSKIKRIKFAAIAKRKNELYLENKKSSFLLKELPQDVSNLILRIRDESHRFAISYHKKLRKRTLFEN